MLHPDILRFGPHLTLSEPDPDRRSIEQSDVRTRWSVAATWAGVAITICLLRHFARPELTSDLDQLWFSARALAKGGDPYTLVGRGRAFDWPWPLYFPLPAVLAVAPLAVLPLAAARVAFAGMTAGALGFAVGGRWRVLWPLLVSAPFYLAVAINQWSPLILAAVWFPALGFVFAVKPNVGTIAVVAQDARGLAKVALGAGLLLTASLVIRPDWPREWWELARTSPDKHVMILQPGGFLLLSSLVLWRRPEGRVLAAISLIPHTPSLYELLPVFIACRTFRQALVLSFLTHVLYFLSTNAGPFPTFSEYSSAVARLAVPVVLLPAVGVAFWNEYAGRHPPVQARRPAGRARVWWLVERMLVVVSAVLLLLELWVTLA